MELLLIRHALPVRIVGADDDGPADPPLADLGHQQAAALAAALVEEGIDVVYSSPLRRARQTAEPLAAALGLELGIVDALAEFDRLSTWYIPIEELRAAGDPRWLDVLGTAEDSDLEREAFRASAVAAIEALIAAHPGRRVAAIAHGGVLNAYVAHLLQSPLPGIFEPAYTSITRVLGAGSGERTLKSMNEAHHVRGLLPPGSR